MLKKSLWGIVGSNRHKHEQQTNHRKSSNEIEIHTGDEISGILLKMPPIEVND